MKLLDAKIDNPIEKKDPTPFDMIKNYFLNRYSSAIRIPLNSLAAGVAGAFFGMGKALYKDLPKRPFLISYGLGAFGMGFLYFNVNEVANGIVRRSIDREQLFYSNTVAAVVTNVATFSFLNMQNKAPLQSTLLRSIKYTWTLCLAAIMWDIYIVQMRHYFLIHGLDQYRKEIFKINRLPSEGTKWLQMKNIQQLREKANQERYGTNEMTSSIISNKDETMTFEKLKEQVKRHKEYLETQNMLSESVPSTSIFTKSAQSKQSQQSQSQQLSQTQQLQSSQQQQQQQQQSAQLQQK